jgi:hypothetical protein
MATTRIAFLALITLACSLPAWSEASAAPGVNDVVAELNQASYRGILEDLLETHAGDNRGFVWSSSQNAYYPSAGHDIARDNILSWFSGLGLDASLAPFTFGSYVGCNNVLGVLPGHINPQAVYIIGGHYDSVGNPGADDNASGVAGVMEAARILANMPLACTVIFVAWDGEEEGLKGSYHWVNTQDESVVDGVVNLDMIAYNHNGTNNATVYGSAAWRAKWVAAATAYAPDIKIIEYTSNLSGSDHWPFQSASRPAGGIIEAYPLPNPNYHKQSDSVDTLNYIDYDYAMKLLASGVGLLLQEADLLLPGDTDNDKDVDYADYINLVSHFGMTTGAQWSTGDFNADGQVDAFDYIALNQNYGDTLAHQIPATVPEPASMLILAAAGLLALARPKLKMHRQRPALWSAATSLRRSAAAALDRARTSQPAHVRAKAAWASFQDLTPHSKGFAFSRRLS